MSVDDVAMRDALAPWMNQVVFIRKGRFVGHVGEIIGFANGKFRVKVGTDDIVNKQVTQVELYNADLHRTARRLGDDTPGVPKPPRTSAKSSGPKLIGSRVRIMAGKFVGEVGNVVYGGNGYFAVEIARCGEDNPVDLVMKRSSDLQVVDGDANSMSEDDVWKAAAILLNLTRQDAPARKRCRTEMAGTVTPGKVAGEGQSMHC
ncbi:KOW domain-containing protein [Plasmodiophora brassicae]|uniref:KOW domain-containing protein n=1 Tax=Plasmodiophora brassicae TaxID=37360 RepID=A0A0G4IGE9_PLABS|nr:hypothetical protein PBRA_000051 [Plasmodiophora brassicae]SPQ96626.1 unnamed protein product [Plasmodiophora brassicae]